MLRFRIYTINDIYEMSADNIEQALMITLKKGYKAREIISIETIEDFIEE